jgi:hypothetical protein
LSTNASAIAADRQLDWITLAALIGAIRGDLWAESAFSYADLLLANNEGTASANVTQKLARAAASLEHALNDAPAQPSAWLLRAELALRYPSLGFNVTEALKMSYYTGPSEQNLLPQRLRIVASTDTFSDIEMRQFVSRDVRLLLARKQKSEVAQAYNTASSSGRRFIEQTVKDIDPSVAESLRTGGGAPKQSLPD